MDLVWKWELGGGVGRTSPKKHRSESIFRLQRGAHPAPGAEIQDHPSPTDVFSFIGGNHFFANLLVLTDDFSLPTSHSFYQPRRERQRRARNALVSGIRAVERWSFTELMSRGRVFLYGFLLKKKSSPASDKKHISELRLGINNAVLSIASHISFMVILDKSGTRTSEWHNLTLNTMRHYPYH